MTKLWTDYYAPESLLECVGNTDVIKKMIEWLKDWDDVIIHKTLKKDKPVFKAWG